MTPSNFPQQIAKLIPRLGSEFDGEVVATARAIERTLSGAGLDWHDVADALTQRRTAPTALGRSDWCEKAWFCHRHGFLRLSEAERKFITDMTRFHRRPSEKQLAWLDAIYARIQREAA